MPELPEVETVRRGLIPAMEGARIKRAEVRRDGLRWPFPENMAKRLSGRLVQQLGRRSKYLLADLDSGETLLIHLGMSGRILVSGKSHAMFHHDQTPLDKHDHVVLHMDNGIRITFNDARRFGMMDMWPTAEIENHPLLAKLGPEPLSNQFNSAYLAARLKRRGTPIKTALLDQKIVAGLGNIYVCEILHRTGISPRRKASNLSSHQLDSLIPAIRSVLEEAIAAGGSSLRDHRQTNGDLGYFQHSFRAYGREGKPCPNSGCKGEIMRITQSGRSSFFCPQCQR